MLWHSPSKPGVAGSILGFSSLSDETINMMLFGFFGVGSMEINRIKCRASNSCLGGYNLAAWRLSDTTTYLDAVIIKCSNVIHFPWY